MPSEAPDGDCLRDWLRASTLAVRKDGGSIDSNSLSQTREALVKSLQPFQRRRIALLSSQAEHILSAIAAAQEVDCEILLLRTDKLSPDRAQIWKISAIIDATLHVQATSIEDEQVTPDGFRILIATSGTTGEPKLARHTIQALLGRVRLTGKKLQNSRWLLTYHPATFGGMQVLLTALAAGDEIVSVSQPTVQTLCETALASHPTHISGTPTFWRSFLLSLGPRAASLDLRQITLGGEIADEWILNRLRNLFPTALISHIYASTEAGALFSVKDGRAGFPASWLETGIDGVQLRIRDGILQVKSPRSMNGYVGVEKPGILTTDGWIVTGDLVEAVGDRVLFRGREDFMLNVGGAKVRPEEVEEALLSLSEVADAKVYGVRNPITGFVIGADIVLQGSLGEAEARTTILTKLREKLEAYKVPRILRFADSIAMSMSGKKETAQ